MATTRDQQRYLRTLERDPENVILRRYMGGGVGVRINPAAGQLNPTNASPINFTVTFSQPVSGFVNADVVFTGSTAPGTLAATVTGGPSVYNVAVSGMTGNGSIVPTIIANAATTVTGAKLVPATAVTGTAVFYDIVGPTVTINQAAGQADPTSGATVNYTVQFSEFVTGFVTGDVSFTGSTVGGTLLGTVTGGGALYNVAVTGMAAPAGNIVASIPANMAADLAGNLSAASTSTDNTVAWTVPVGLSVTINQAAGQADPTNLSTVNFTVVFSAPVTGFVTGDVSFAGSTVGGTLTGTVSGGPSTYNVAVTGMTGSGTIVASVPAGVAIDGSSNPNPASTSTDNTVTWTLGGEDSATTAWATAVVTNGGTVSSPRRTLVDNLIVGLRTDGIWAKLDRLWLHAAENQPAGLTDLVAASLATNVSAMSFTVDRGFTGGGVAYLSTNFNPSIGTNKYLQNDAHLSGWTSLSSGVGDVLIGMASTGSNIFAPYSGSIYGRINDNPESGAAGAAPVNPRGFWVANRTGASASAVYQNAVLFGSPNQASGAVNNDTFLIGKEAGVLTGHRASATSIGGSLTPTDITNFYNRLKTYMQAVGVEFDPNAGSVTTWENAVIANGGTVSAGRHTLVDNLIAGLKTDGVWSKIERLWLFAAENAPSALTDLKSNLATAINSPTFTVDRGYVGSVGASSYVDTNFSAALAFIHLQDSAHLSVWDVTAGSADASKVLLGMTGSTYSHIYARYTDNLMYARISSSLGAGFAVADSRGHALGNRSGPTARQVYKNGVSVGSDTDVSSPAPASQTFTAGFNVGVVCPDQIAAVTAGASLTATDVTNLYNRLRTYMTAVGVP